MIPSAPAPSTYEGVVSAFDAEVGLGQIRTTDGVADADEIMVGFHCVALADGSRQIEVGTMVRFAMAPGLHGRWEAASVTPLG
ncbi:MAG: hypothetical protein ACKV2O_19075 [Acidimicrobiales bacterium]